MRDLAALLLPDTGGVLGERGDELLAVDPRVLHDAVATAVDLPVGAADLAAYHGEVVRADAEESVRGPGSPPSGPQQEARSGALTTSIEPFTRLLRITTPLARITRSQLTVFESMTVLAAVMVHGPV